MPPESTDRTGRAGETVHPETGTAGPGTNSGALYGGVPPSGITESGIPDLTLRCKQALFAGLLAAGQTGPGRMLGTYLVRPGIPPAIALQAGEALVSRPSRVLAFTAHADDLEFFAGGTIRRLVLAGSRVTAVVMSDGEKRGNDAALGEIRRSEQSKAAGLQGFAELHFCGLPDFGLPEDPRLEPLVAQAWEQATPEVVLAFDPQELVPMFANRDHKALGRTVMDVARRYARSGIQVFFYGTHHTNVLVDVTSVIEDKESAVLAHHSQLPYLTLARSRDAVRYQARLYGGKTCQYGEGLYRLM